MFFTSSGNAARMAAWLLLSALSGAPALAHEGHDDDAASNASSGAAPLPRFAAWSDLFELVGTLDGTHLTLYLDHFADNAPVQDAQLELDIGSAKVPVRAVAAGQFEATLAAALPEGITAVTAMVSAGKERDLLVAELDIHAPKAGHALTEATPVGWQGWLLRSGAILATFGALAALVFLMGQWQGRGRRAGGTA